MDHGVQYYAHAIGTFQDSSVYSWRYMAGFDRAPQGTIAENFDYHIPLRRFHRIFDNGKYSVYRILWPKDMKRAHELAQQAEVWLLQGDEEMARGLFLKSLLFDPNRYSVYFKLARLYKQKNQNDEALQATKEGLRLARHFKAGSST